MHVVFDYRSNGLRKDSEELDVSRQSVWSVNRRCCLISLNLQGSQSRVVHCPAHLTPFRGITSYVRGDAWTSHVIQTGTIQTNCDKGEVDISIYLLKHMALLVKGSRFSWLMPFGLSVHLI